MMTKLVCLINNYNYSEYLPECLDSVFSQTHPFYKVMVVDDGSTDESVEIIKNYQKLYKNLF